MTMRFDLGLVKEAVAGWTADKASRSAAAISYTTVFAIAPLFIITIAIAGAVLGFTNGGHGHHIVENKLIDAVRSSAGTSAAQTVREMVDASYRGKQTQGVLAQIIGYVTFIVGAMSLFAALQDALNTVWHVEPPADKPSWLVQLRSRLASFGLVVGIGFLLLVTFVANAAILFVSSHVQALLPFPGAGAVFAVINYVVSIALIAAVFAAMYKVLPDVEIAWHDVWLGAAVTAVLFVVGQAAIGFYLAHAGVGSAYGAAGSLLVLLVWIYYSAMVMLLGAEFTKAYAHKHGSRAGQPLPQASAANVATVRDDVNASRRPTESAPRATTAAPPRPASGRPLR